MKHLNFLLFTVFLSFHIHAQQAPIVTTWEIKQAFQEITIPTTGTGYNYNIDFGDGTFQNNVTGDVTHAYFTPGIYTVTITGEFPRIYFYNSNTANSKRLLSVEQWGDIQWQSMNGAFAGCSNLVVNATDAPDLSLVTDMSYMFYWASSFNQPINHWDVSNIENMTGLFRLAQNFNQPLNNWDVSNVTNMSEMFFKATVFDQTLANWNVSNVTDMKKMFQEAEFFNHSINNWDVSNVINMENMFQWAYSFNQPLNMWNVSNVINMRHMFLLATSFNQPLNNWSVGNVTDMSSMLGAESFNQDISDWNFNSLVNLNYFIGGSGLSRDNYDNLLLAFYNLGLQNKTLHSSNLAYCDEITRDALITTRGWTITGDYFFSACALTQSDPFITTWEVTQDDLRIDIPTTGTGYNYAIDFGDGHILTNLSGDATHTYSTPGVYTVKIAGYFPRIYFNNSGDKNKILSIEQWGDIQWQSMDRAFYGCNNLVINATDAPNLSQVTDMSRMFLMARLMNQNIDHWDVSNVTNMSHMFYGAYMFNQPLNSWDVSNVTNMYNMFAEALAFNQNLSNWDVSNVTNMDSMFARTNEFNQPLDTWNVSNVTDMRNMFLAAKSFNQPLNNWNTSNVTNMSWMFSDTESFNQPLNNWNVSNVTQLNGMFLNAMTFNQNLSTWNFNAITNYTYFLNNTKLDVSNYEALLAKFELLGFQNKTLDARGLLYCNALSHNELVNNLGWTINGDAHLVNCNTTIPPGAFVTRWAVESSNLTITIPTLGSGYNYTIDYGDGTIQNNVTGNSTHTYAQAGAYTVSITGDFPRIYFNLNFNRHAIISIEQWGNILWQSMARAFSGCSNLVINATDAPDLSQVSSMERMFQYCTSLNQNINHWNVSNVTNMKELFNEAQYFNKPLNNWNVSNVTDMSYMFSNAHSFNQSINNWDVSNVLNMEYMFNRAGYNKSLNNWDVSNVINMKSMLSSVVFNMPIDNWDVSNVTDMSHMFDGNYTFNQPIDSWDVSNVTTMSHMFYKAASFNQPLNNWDVSSVTDMNFMFSANIVSTGSNFNHPLSNWDVSGVIDMSYMFSAAKSFNKDISNWTFNPTVNLTGFIGSSGLDTFNYEALLSRFVQLGYHNKTLGASTLKYCDDVSRNELINNMGWTIHDGGWYNNCGLFSNNPFTTTWYVSGTGGQSYPLQNLSISIPTNGNGYSYEIDFGDGTVVNSGNEIINHTYSQPGTYTVKIKGNFPSIYFYNNYFQSNRHKIVSIDNWGDIVWKSMFRAFYGCENLIINATDAPNLTQVTIMNEMFKDAKSINQPIEHWDVTNVEHFSKMFEGATGFNQPLNNWDMTNAISIYGMFKNATSFNQPLNNWDVSNISSLVDMFNEAVSFNQDLSDWDVSNVISMGNVFNNAILFDQDLSNWNFNPTVLFTNGGSSTEGFVSNSGLSVSNYDALLVRFVQLGLNNKVFAATGLEYCNYVDRDYLLNNLSWIISGDSYSTDCSAIIGTIIFDENNDGCDPNDISVSGFMVNAYNGSNSFSTFSSNGVYNLGVLGTSLTVSVVNSPSYFSVNPASANVNFSGSNTEVLDFCVTSTQIIEDLNITIIPTGQARPGFEADYRLVIRNVGTETIANVEATLEFDDLMQQFVLANPTPWTMTNNTLTFPIGTIQPFQKFEADITMLTFQPPTVNGGDILNFTATVTPVANDHTPIDNTYNLAQVVVNSFDPNDKQVLQGEELHIDRIDEYLDYLIRFQNTGTASAINVRILDTLHPKLDWSTLIPISASHDYYVNITDGNRVEFMFDNIHLPDSLSNEPDSHGFVAYKIKPKSNVQVGDVISGDAAIYFDFNAPIITNMVQTEVVEPLSIADVSNPLNQVFLYPNPANKTLHIHLTDGIELEEVLIYDLQGREVQKIQGKETTLDVEHLRSGMYLLKITTNRGTINRQLIKN